MSLKKFIQKKDNLVFFIISISFIFLILLSGVNSLTGFLIFGTQSQEITILPNPAFTENNLTCEISLNPHPTNYRIRWFKDEIEQTSLENETTISSTNTLKNEIWTCELTVYDEPGDQFTTHRTISNTPPSEPIIMYDSQVVNDGFVLIEDQEYIFTIVSTDPDNDPLSYFVIDLGNRGLCSLISNNEVSCTATHYTITGTTAPSPEESINYLVEFQVRDGAPEGVIPYVTINFNLTPVNDQATIPSLPDVVLNATIPWELLIVGEDEELDYPLNFSVSSTNGTHNNVLSFLEPTNIDDTSFILGFVAGAPRNNDAGIWNVTINVTDSLGSNDTRPAFSRTFQMEILRTNEAPNLTTDLSNIQGTQGEPFELFLESEADLEIDNNISLILLKNDHNEHCTTDIFDWKDYLTVIESNNTNATMRIFVPELTNNHVICRNLTIRLSEQDGAFETVNAFFNITNINDAPIIHELSFNESNIGAQENISNLSVSLYATPSFYTVNATDPDMYTYDAANTAILTYTTNDSNFYINPDTGVINLEFSDPAMIGTWPVLVTATDNDLVNPLSDSIIMNVNILPNSPPEIFFDETNLVFNQNEEVLIFINTTDIDGDDTYLLFESLENRFPSTIYDFSKEHYYSELDGFANNTVWVINLSKWIQAQVEALSPSPKPELFANALVGTHNITVKAYDSLGAHNEEFSEINFNFTILNENDAPFFDSVIHNNISDGPQIVFPPIPIDEVFVKNIYVTDFDLFLPEEIYEESLSFNITEHSGLTQYSFEKVNNNEAILTFIPLVAGTNHIVLEIKDLMNATESQRINFTVYEKTPPPIFLEVMPYFDNGLTVTSFINTSGLTQPLYVRWQENSSLTFDADISFAPNIVAGDLLTPNYLNVNWIVNDVLVESLTNVTPSVNTEHSVYFDFFSEGINNITMVATDSVNSTSNWTWQVNITNVNRRPIFCFENPLQDIETSGRIVLSNYLAFSTHQRFYDPDDDPENDGINIIDPCTRVPPLAELPSLNFSYEFLPYCNADITFNGSTVIFEAYSKGICEVIFYARDEYDRQAESNIVRVTIHDALTSGDVQSERIVTVTERITIPIEEQVDIPKPAKIIYPGPIVFYENQTIEVPLIIKNTWEEALEGISLSATALNNSMSSEQENMTISFSLNQINILQPNQEQESTLSLTNYRIGEPLMINLFAEVTNPNFVDSDTLIIAGMEQTGDSPQSVRTLVTYARDLLQASPECAELNDLLNNAQNSLDSGFIDDALRLIDGAINGCKYLLTEQERFRTESPSTLKAGISFTTEYWFEIIMTSIALIFVAIVFYVFSFIRLTLKK